MFVIEDSNHRFCKIMPTGKKVFTPDVREAEEFHSEREANDYLRKNYKKKATRNFKIVRKEEYEFDFITREVDNHEELVDETFSISGMKDKLNETLTEQINIYKQEVSIYERMISDIQHFLRKPDINLSPYESYLALEKFRKILMARAENKKELQRMRILRAETSRAMQSAEDFKYKEYQNKVITDVRAFLISDKEGINI